MWPFGRSKDKRTVRYGVVGLGWIAQEAVLPAFANAENSELVALVSSDRQKLKQLGSDYKVNHLYDYAHYDELLKSGEIDAVYIALPNTMHREYAVKAARAGIHVLCEKPLATSVVDARAITQAAKRHKIKLMTAYRLHFEECNLKAVELVTSGKIGEPRIFNSIFAQNVKPSDIRLNAKLGGGTLWDLGVYCVNAARYLFRSEPYEVECMATYGTQKRFREVEEMVSCQMHFPGGRLASFDVSFGMADVSRYSVLGTMGEIRVDPAYGFQGERSYQLYREGKLMEERRYRAADQFAPELLHFSKCVLENRAPEPSGHEGQLDVQIIAALYKSARTGKRVRLDLATPRRRPVRSQTIKRSAVSKPRLIHATTPHA
jgi:predicted dehydrogenase